MKINVLSFNEELIKGLVQGFISHYINTIDMNISTWEQVLVAVTVPSPQLPWRFRKWQSQKKCPSFCFLRFLVELWWSDAFKQSCVQLDVEVAHYLCYSQREMQLRCWHIHVRERFILSLHVSWEIFFQAQLFLQSHKCHCYNVNELLILM